MRTLFVTLCLRAVTIGSSEYSTNYNERKARELLDIAAGVYGNKMESCLENAFPTEMGYKMLDIIEENCYDFVCSAIIASSEKEKELVIGFKGSDNMQQIAYEGIGHFMQKQFEEFGKVNSFFLEAHRALWPQIAQVLKNDAFKDYGVVFTGHSLGGAVAAMSAVKAVKLGLLSTEQVTIYTYGEPRVGDYTFAKNFDELVRNSYRVVNRFDSVVHLGSCVSTNNPMYDLSTHVRCRTEVNNTYYHHGTEIWYPEGMAPGSAKMECVGEPRGEDEKCSNSEDLMQNAEYMYHDHLFYFSKQVAQYGRSGCEENYESIAINEAGATRFRLSSIFFIVLLSSFTYLIY